MQDLQQKEKSVKFSIEQPIQCEYKASCGQGRFSEVELLKIRDTKNGHNCYVALAENRQVNTLHRMVLAREIQFTKEDMALQLNIYMSTINSLLEEDEVCCNKCLIIHYEDHERFDFAGTILRELQKLKS